MMGKVSKMTGEHASRGRGVVAALLLISPHVAAVLPAAADPAVTTHDAREFTVRPLPCAPDPGYFALTVTYNATSRMSEDGDGHFTNTGTFSAVPVEVTRFEDITDDDHDTPYPWSGGDEPAASTRDG